MDSGKGVFYWQEIEELRGYKLYQSNENIKEKGPSTRTNFRKSNTLRHFEVEAVRERFLKELGMLNPFLGSAKVKNAYFVWYPKIFNMADKML